MHSHRLRRTRCHLSVLLLLVLTGMLSLSAQAQRTINDADRVILHGNTHPLARAEFDRGSANASMPMNRMVLLLSVRPDAQAALQQLLADQQDPKSPDFHKWLTPSEFGLRFGPTDQDIADAGNWLKKFGFTIDEIGNGRLWINFSGDVQKVERAFQTNIRNYEVDGKMHFANATDPSIPRALTGLVQSVVSLHDFTTHPNSTASQLPIDFTNAGGAHLLAPGDFATIYNVKPLYNAAPPIDGTGQTIAIVGRTDINLSDVQFFRSFFGLPAKDPVFIHNGPAPGNLGPPEETEADLDVEWSGAVARNATIDFVISQTTATDGVVLSAQFIVNTNLANIMSTSFGSCEFSLQAGGNNFWNTLWAQAAAQGITSFVSAGDSGAAACDSSGAVVGTRVNVNGVASTPNNIAVGGTQFNEGAGNFWAAVNNADQSSALSYIPEIAWNESGSVAGGSGLFSTGGGASQVYTKPAFQAGPGVPADGARDIPDVSLSSAGHDGYIIVQGHTAGTNGLFSVGGTSAASPSFAGLMALVVQKTGVAQGNANPIFYSMGQNQFGGGIAVYHDTTTGNNSVPGIAGFSAGVGYDLATGWGSVDASQMVNFWNNNGTPDFSLAATPASQSVNQGSTATYTVTESVFDNYANTVTFSVSGLPAGASPTFAPPTLSGAGTSSLAISTTATTPLGSYPLTITGTDGVLTHTASVTLVITTPDFSLTATPAVQTVVVGNTANYTATVTALNGYAGTVNLSVSGLPAGASPLFTPPSVTGSGSSGLAITTTAGTTPSGSYPLVITATDGVLTHTANVTLVVSDFVISASPASQTVLQGNSTSYTVSLTTAAGYVGTVSFSVSGLPTSTTPVFSPTSLTASGTTTLTISTSGTSPLTPPGTYPLTISAGDGVSTQTTQVTLVVTPIADFGVSISPTSQTVNQGQNIGYGVTVSSVNGFAGLVNLSITGLPPGASFSFNPSSLQGSGLSSLAIVPGANTPGGTYTLTITGTSGPLVHSTTAMLTILVPDFSLSSAPASRTILVGQSTSYTVTFSPVNEYAGTVNFTVIGLPTGAVPLFNPGSLSSAGTTTLSITTDNTIPPGVYPLTITGSDGTLTRSISVSLEVDAVPPADFTISAPPTITVKRNSTGSETVTISAVNSFTGVVNLSASNLPSLVTASFAPTSVTNSGTSKLTFTVDHRAAQGVYNVTVTGTSGLLVHSTTVTLTVN
ncbi:MAG TPA: protease pro-enzyme activation domain-containing protein [Candidatus Angelobacter sp.]|nr:protease pro-enzyme activation domain-containing protein [Candidatus Angelobacter sp.]